jgi:hypothetical protein
MVPTTYSSFFPHPRFIAEMQAGKRAPVPANDDGVPWDYIAADEWN